MTPFLKIIIILEICEEDSGLRILDPEQISFKRTDFNIFRNFMKKDFCHFFLFEKFSKIIRFFLLGENDAPHKKKLDDHKPRKNQKIRG